MEAAEHDVLAALRGLNPWWRDTPDPDLPQWSRPALGELMRWLADPPAPRAVVLQGLRQVGKTTLLRQAARALVAGGRAPAQILYANFDLPILRLAGLAGVLRVWHEHMPRSGDHDFLLLDEIQQIPDWTTWLKLQVDFEKRTRIAVSASAAPLASDQPESGVGRLRTLPLLPLSLREYLDIRGVAVPELPALQSLTEVRDWSNARCANASEDARTLVPHFHEYLLRGGFPQMALVESVNIAQQLVREDVIDRVLKRDMTSFFGVRRVAELEQAFLYLCLHDGGLVDVTALASSLGVSKPTVNSFLAVLEAAHLVHKLPPHGYGKQVLRGRSKVYLADAALAGAIMMRGTSLLEDETRLGAAVETSLFVHVRAASHRGGAARVSYWRGRRDREVDFVVERGEERLPCEVKYRGRTTDVRELPGLFEFCRAHGVVTAVVITRDVTDFGPTVDGGITVLRIPAVLACWWLSEMSL